MARLLGKADPTLVAGAHKAAMANVPGDYSKQFGIMADASKTLFKGVESIWKEHQESKKVNQKALDEAMTDLRNYGVGIENNADYNMFSDEMDEQVRIYKENKGFKFDSKAFADWKRQNNKIMGKYKNNQIAMQDAIDAFGSNDAWKEGMSTGLPGEVDENGNYSNNVGFLTSLVKYAKNADDKSGKYNADANTFMQGNTGADSDKTPKELWKHLSVKDGEVVKYIDPATNEFNYITSIDGNIINKKASEISGLIPTKEEVGETFIWEDLNSIATQSSKGDKEYSAYHTKINQAKLTKMVDERQDVNDRAFEYLAQQKYGPMDMSFAEALGKGKAPISEAIKTSLQQIKGWKGSTDDILDSGDFESGTNYQTIVNSILKGKDNYELSRDLFVDYVDQEAYEVTWTENKRPKAGKISAVESETGWLGSGDALAVQGGNRYLDYDVAKDIYDSFVTAKDGNETNFNMFNVKYDYDPTKDNWSDGETDFGNSESFRKSLGISESDFKEITSIKKVTKEGDKEIVKFEKTPSPTLGLETEDFSQSEDTFTTMIKEKYDLSDYIVKDARGIAGLEHWSNAISIYDKEGNELYRTQTNFSNVSKAGEMAKKWNKAMKKLGIKLKVGGILD